jgi:ribonuclease BN (tRNA processing enzyme)
VRCLLTTWARGPGDYARLVKITVLGGCGAWPAAGQACSGYLVEHEGFRLVLDPGYATLPQLLTADGRVLAYTGDTGPSPDIATMARDCDVLLAEATFPDHVLPAQDARYLSTARQAGEYAAKADARRLVLTHLWPGTDPSTTRAAAQRAYSADLDIATPGMTIDLG